MFNRHKHILVFFGILGVLLVPVGDIMTIQGRFAKGDDSSIYLVDFDETDYDLYINGYYPSDYTYDDFRRDSIAGMVSHYIATDNNNFSAVVDTIENDVLQNGWSVIKDFFVDSWIDLKSGVVTVVEGFTDDFKHELDGRFKTTPSPDVINTGNGTWYSTPYLSAQGSWYVYCSTSYSPTYTEGSAYTTILANGNSCTASYYSTGYAGLFSYSQNSPSGTPSAVSGLGGTYTYNGVTYKVRRGGSDIERPYGASSNYSSYDDAFADFYGYSPDIDPIWNGTGYYSDIPTNYSINLPALPAIDWQSISNNNKNTYGVDFPDVDLTVDFQLPDSYYPQSVTYDTPYWLYNTDSTPVDWANVSFEDVTLPQVQLSDGDGSFFQALFNTLPLAFVPILLGVILCYLIFLML